MSPPYYTHINRNVIDSNRKNKVENPPISIRRGKYGKAKHAFEIELPAGSKMIYSAHEPILPCGARMVIVSDIPPIILR